MTNKPTNIDQNLSLKPVLKWWWPRFIGVVLLIYSIMTIVEWLVELMAKGFPSLSDEGLMGLRILLVIILLHAGYTFYIRWTESRPCYEFNPNFLVSELSIGIGVGFGLISLVVLILMAIDAYQVEAMNNWWVMFSAIHLQSAVYAGYVEELLFRGVLFRMTEEKLGTWLALAIQALLFGLLHGANPNATFLSLMAIALEAGILLGVFYVLTKRLWMSIGVHAGWNFSEGAIYGSPVSGFQMQGWIISSRHGSDWLTGGTFGLEASLVTFLICTSLGLGLLVWAHKSGKNQPLKLKPLSKTSLNA